ncbi:MAG: hypothetical protein HC836_18045 [Richelia sp. RM2_1_2]|nr:hypothetical protein [Richelia sp. RM1_1_1]NJO60100.1 hypothetical protein [Richelia sp. RM2_1_2]
MPQNRNTSILPWTYKHDEYCLENGITPSAKLLWQWLVKKGYVSQEIIDLKEFNGWVAKHRLKGAFSNKALKLAFNKLIECRAINLLKGYTWNIVKIITRPIEYLKPRKKVQKRDIFSNLDGSKPSKYNVVDLQQQQLRIVENKITFSRYGIHFDGDELEVLDRPKNEILLSIVCYQIADESRITHGNELKITRGKINNPEGWIRTCLRRRYWDKPRTYQQIINKYGNTTFILELFPDIQ